MADHEIPLLASKLHAPRLRRGVVARGRLAGRLDRASLPPVVLVSAPAGFGKTTMLAEWLAGTDEPTAWLSLDRRDSDPSVFWAYVVAALRTAVPEVGAEALTTLRSSPAASEAAVTSLLNELAAHGDEVVLVLDDYHAVESLDVHESTRFLVEHLPPNVHLVVASRADPPWPLAGLRAKGQLAELRAADLRFTGAEAAAYLNDSMGLHLDPADVDALEARTEGWIAALQLAALSLEGRDDTSGFIASFAGDDRFVVDYLADEVLDRQPGDVRAFLLDTSILGRLSAPLCAAVTGRDDAKALLDRLERSNLFVVALDDRRQWFRYHHLFADVLRARLADEHPDRMAELHRRAAAWFEADGDPAEAIRHSLSAGDLPKAAELVELAIPALRRARQDATQREWLEALPRDVFADRPVLTIELVGARMVTGDVDGVAELLDQVERWLDPDHPTGGMIVHDRDELARLPAQAAMYRAALALLGGDLAGAVVHAERAGHLSGDDDHVGRGAAAALVGLVRWAEGDLDTAASRYATAIAEFAAADFLPDILGCSLVLADIQAAQGRLGDAERTLRAGLALAAANGPLRGTADMHVGLAELHLERNELDRAADELRASLEVGEHLALAQHAWRWRVVDARLRAIAGDADGALALLAEAEARYDTDFSPKARPVAATTARVRLLLGDLAGAERWAASSATSPDAEPDHLHEYELLTLGRIFLAAGRVDEAEPLLRRVLAAADEGGRAGGAVEAGALLAVALHATGDAGQALATAEQALTRAEPERFVRTFLDAGAPMSALLEAAVRHGRAARQAEALLAATRAASATAERGPAGQPLVDELSSRELDVLRLLRTDLSGPEIASELVVSVNTVRTHTKNIFTKLGVNSRRAAVRRADELGL